MSDTNTRRQACDPLKARLKHAGDDVHLSTARQRDFYTGAHEMAKLLLSSPKLRGEARSVVTQQAEVAEEHLEAIDSKIIQRRSVTEMPQQLNVENFEGTVVLKDWMLASNGEEYRAFYGKVSILEAQQAVGFAIENRDANWFARVEGENSSYNILGCQIRGIIQGPCDAPRARQLIYSVP